MRSSRSSPLAALVMVGLLGVTPAAADPISTLYSTGVDDFHNPLPGGSIDPHWELTVSPDPAYPGPDAFVLSDSAPLFSNGGTPNTSTSKWIGPRADGGHNFPRSDCTVGCTTADYHFETVFDLTGLDPLTAQITGQWSVDDSAIMLLNGVQVASYPFIQGVTWREFAPFTVTSGFVAGVNTLTVIVNNQFYPNSNLRDNATGMQVQLTGTANIPEPASLLLLAGGVSALRVRRSTVRR